MFNFEKLDVWHQSIALANRVYILTKSFPTDERFGLTNQLRRAVVSISSNMGRFVEIATGSTFEVVSQARVAREQGLLSATEHDEAYRAVLEIVRMLSGLRRTLKD